MYNINKEKKTAESYHMQCIVYSYEIIVFLDTKRPEDFFGKQIFCISTIPYYKAGPYTPVIRP